MSSEFVAAIDLGSNSFHMIVARIVDGHVQVLDRLREMVQLAAGLDSHNRLSVAAQHRALDCLARFGQRLRHIPPKRLRIVGTNTLRQARNSAEFIRRAEQVLGHKVEIVSGQEEARLIYLGVAHSVAGVPGNRLVVDIGGGSTELIIGEQFESSHLMSLRMGCVSLTRAFFDDGRVRAARMRKADLFVQLQLEPVREEYAASRCAVVTGASGSIKAIQDVVIAEGWCREGITIEALRQLRATLLEQPHADALAARWQLDAARARVFVGGFLVLHGVFEALGVQQMEVSEGALREGLIYDLLGRIRHEDVRDRTIANVIQRFGLDPAQAERVSSTALELLRQVRDKWHLNRKESRELLARAARVHEVGLLLSHDAYHRHGAYLLEHSDLPGYSRDDQRLLAALVQCHRRSLSAKAFARLPHDWQSTAKRLCVLLRLAVVLHRGRSSEPLPSLQVRADRSAIELLFPPGWLQQHPLTHADLEFEAEYLKQAGFRLHFADAPAGAENKAPAVSVGNP